jgi:hypothetical protein
LKTTVKYIFWRKISRSVASNKNQGDSVAPWRREIKMEQFLRKRGFTETLISKNMHLGFSSNFAKNSFNIKTTTSSF